MEHEHIITGLLRKRQSIGDELDAAENKVRLLVQAIDAVDATIKLFRPDMKIGIVRVRPTPRRHTAFRGESSQMILNMLREAGGPMTTRDVVLAAMAARGLNTADKPMAETMRMRMRVSASLRGMRERRSVISREGRGAFIVWTLAEA